MKPRRGLSFFLNTANKDQFSFGIVLSAKSDDEGEYKILRTEFAPSKVEALKLPLTKTDMFDFEDTEYYNVEEWDSETIRSLSKRQLFGATLDIKLLPAPSKTPIEEKKKDIGVDDLAEED